MHLTLGDVLLSTHHTCDVPPSSRTVPQLVPHRALLAPLHSVQPPKACWIRHLRLAHVAACPTPHTDAVQHTWRRALTKPHQRAQPISAHVKALLLPSGSCQSSLALRGFAPDPYPMRAARLPLLQASFILSSPLPPLPLLIDCPCGQSAHQGAQSV